ncbi:MAG: HAMP domain-containing sensor histidine kinase [Acidimicrobiales bacterium]|nr:HAMP domain-containing sensor histidine kinase [Acidimicrobiales bacterium]
MDAEEYLAFGAASVLVMSAMLLVSRWRFTRSAPVLWLALSCGAVAATVVARCVASTDAVGLGWLRPVGLATAVTALAAGVAAAAVPAVDTTVRGLRLTAVAGGVVVAAGLLAAGFTTVGLGLPGHSGAADALVVAVALAAGWAGVAGLWLWRGRVEDDWTLSWFALLAAALAGKEIAGAVAAAAERPVPVAAVAVVAVGALCGARGAARALQLALDVQARELDETRENLGAADHEVRTARAAAEERAHEARNALSAVGAAIQTLERYHGDLDPVVRAGLADGISFELERLQRLVDIDATPSRPALLPLGDALAPVVQGARSQGLAVAVDVDASLCAFADPMAVAEVTQNLLVNAHRHASGVEVVLEARMAAGRVLVTVADGGPGVPAGERDVIFERRTRNHGSSGCGFGLLGPPPGTSPGRGSVVADRPGGGAVFGFDLPAVSGPGPTLGSPARAAPSAQAVTLSMRLVDCRCPLTCRRGR